MSGNRFGTLFQYHSWGESHGPAIGVVVDGVPPGIELATDDIQHWLDRRKPGQSRHTTQRKESDAVEILSGVFEGRTTGAPISLMVRNEDARSEHYESNKDKFRPGHADYTYHAKYGHRDWRGGGRSSARETACRVAAGAIARKILGPEIIVRGAVVQVGPHRIDYERWDWAQIDLNDFYGPDAETAAHWAVFLDETRKGGSSAGAIVEVHAQGVPAGWGAPVYDRLDADIAKALMSINAAKGVEIGAGFDAVWMDGADSMDEIRAGSDGKPEFLSNNAGGILGGISSGQDVVARVAFKPTSSIPTPRQTIDIHGVETDIITTGRHDPCVGIRGVAVAEAMMACVLADHYLRHKAQCL
ncbi:MAG: chorismate synthase [Alphaproteobacteria bacterium]|nr:chorismate synthase [Alphaproteobacteria bacterium]MBU0858774.1 chorismate synthase [Alphaproteobacteria bacterium]